ncbi:hypothetical protein TESS_TESS_01166 [Tessaracoccus sp. O5.2]
MVRRGQLVVGFPIDEGVLDFQLMYPAGIVSPAYGVWNLLRAQDCDPVYLKLFLRSPQALAYYKGKLRGSTARRRSLPQELFLALPVPLPSLEEQKRIAAILDKADAIRAKRRQVLTHLDALTQSIYCDFFRSLSTRQTKPLGSLALKVVVGHVGPTSQHFCAAGVPFLRTGNVGHGRVLTNNLAHVTNEFHKRLKKSQLRAGDVLISRVITDEVRAAMLPDDLEGANCANIIVVRPSELLLGPTVVGYLALPSTQRRLIGRRVGSAQGVVNTTVLKQLAVPVYSLGEQRSLAATVQQIANQRQTLERSLTIDDCLFNSLQARAFRGELC